MTKIFAGPPTPDLVIAVGTAASPGDQEMNGSVFVGTNVFVHDGHPDASNPYSRWSVGPFDRLIASSLPAKDFGALCTFDPSLSTRFALPPLKPSPTPSISALYEYVALTDVNVTDASEYAKKDAETLEVYAHSGTRDPCATVDTTLGLVRCCTTSSFVFISGVSNQIGHFADQVAPREYAQTFAAAHNAGVVFSWLLSKVDSLT